MNNRSPTRDTFAISPTAESSPVCTLGGSGTHLYHPSPSLSAQLTPQPPSSESPFIQPNPTRHNSCPPEQVPNSGRRALEDLALPASPLLPHSISRPRFSFVPSLPSLASLLHCLTSFLMLSSLRARTEPVLFDAEFPGHSTQQALDECLLNACMIDGGRAEIIVCVRIRRMPSMLLRT